MSAVTAQTENAPRRDTYAADIVYTTSKELLADILRERLLLGALADAGRRMAQRLLRGAAVDERTVLRGLHTVIVDEADNQMIDEAVTPLIISRPQVDPALLRVFGTAHGIAAELVAGTHYLVEKSQRLEYPVRCFAKAADKWEAIVREILEVHAQGRPVLVGTRSVGVSEFPGVCYSKKGVPFELLNAIRLRVDGPLAPFACGTHPIPAEFDPPSIEQGAGLRGKARSPSTDPRAGPGQAAL